MTPAEITKLERYLRSRFHDDSLSLKSVEGAPAAGVYVGEDFQGILTRDEDEGEVSYDFVMRLESEEETLTAWEMMRLQQVLAEKLKDPKIQLKTREKKRDSAEVYTDDEFLGVIFLDIEDEDGMASFNMGILDIDLDDTEGSA
jgi:hypothetical protein